MTDADVAVLLAQGVLMCRYRVNRQDALNLLQDMADDGAASVAEIAAGLLDEHERVILNDDYASAPAPAPPPIGRSDSRRGDPDG